MALLNRPNTTVAPQAEPAAERIPEAIQETSATTDIVQVDDRRDLAPTEYHKASATATTLPDFEAAGFEGVDVTNRTFPIIALKTDGVFEDTEQRAWGKSFSGHILQIKKKWVINATKTVAGKTDTQTLFSPNKNITSAGRDVTAVLREWEADGRTPGEWKEYRDVLFTVHAPGEETDEELVILSVSPTSVSRLNNKIIRLTLGIKDPAEVQDKLTGTLMTVSVGAKVTGVDNPFYPWDFKFETAQRAQKAA